MSKKPAVPAKRPPSKLPAGKTLEHTTFREMKAGNIPVPGDLPDWAWDVSMRQLRFIREYVLDMNGMKACLRSGFTVIEAEARMMSSRFLNHDNVRAALATFLSEDNRARAGLRDRVIEELSALSFYDPGDYMKIAKNTVTLTNSDLLSPLQMKAIKRVKQSKGHVDTIEVEFNDKIKAMDLLDRMTGGGSSININNNTQNNMNLGIKVSITPKEAKAI